jgi:hypothetical protein
VGHLFQGRFKGTPVNKDDYLLELSEYVVLDSVWLGLVASPEQWSWSSDRAIIVEALDQNLLAVHELLGLFGSDREYVRWRCRCSIPRCRYRGRTLYRNLPLPGYLGAFEH